MPNSGNTLIYVAKAKCSKTTSPSPADFKHRRCWVHSSHWGKNGQSYYDSRSCGRTGSCCFCDFSFQNEEESSSLEASFSLGPQLSIEVLLLWHPVKLHECRRA